MWKLPGPTFAMLINQHVLSVWRHVAVQRLGDRRQPAPFPQEPGRRVLDDAFLRSRQGLVALDLYPIFTPARLSQVEGGLTAQPEISTGPSSLL